MVHARDKFGVSERRACQVVDQVRSTQRYSPRESDDEPRLVRRIVEFACKFGRYGFRRVTALLRGEGWAVNHKRVERIWRQQGLKVPKRQPKRGRLWLNDGSCVRLRPQYRDHVWSYDFVAARTYDGRPVKILTLMDEFTRECLAMVVARRLTSEGVLDALSELFVRRGLPEHIRSDNGPGFTAKKVREWLASLDVKTLFIEPGSPWENGFIERFNGSLRDEVLNGEIFYTLREAQVVIEDWRHEYNEIRPHMSLGYRPPAPEARVPPGPAGPGGATVDTEWLVAPGWNAAPGLT